MILNINDVIRNILLILVVIYFSQGAFYPSGTIISKISLLIVFAISFVYFIDEALKKNQVVVARLLSLFCVLHLVGYLVGFNYDGTYFSQIRNIFSSLLPFFAIFSLTKKGYVNEKHLKVFFLVMLVVSTILFFKSKTLLSIEQDREDVVSNVGYRFVMLMPFVFLMSRNKLVSTGVLLVMFFLTVQSAKRGALITFGLGAFIYFLFALVDSPKSKRLQNIVVSLIIFIIALYFIYDFVQSNEFLMRRMEGISSGGSGRDRIYSTLYYAWLQSDNLINYIFGFGFVATITHSGTGHLAHNDWLELLVNFGLVGIILYLFIIASFAKYFLNKRNQTAYRYAMLAIISTWLLQTLFSMFYTAPTSMLPLMLAGYLLANNVSSSTPFQGCKQYE